MPKISIIAPAYQAENFLQRYIDCVLNFEHKNIELIIVNDGSTDKTDEIIKNNKIQIENAGIEFKYINLEENKGQANALNIALKYVTGEYLSWQDVDDIYFPNCLSRCLEIALKNPEYKIIFSKAIMVEEENNNNNQSKFNYNGQSFNYLKNLPKKDFYHKNIFKDYILRKNTIWGPMRFVETEALFKVLKDKSIYISNGGQNAQLIFPMIYNYKWIYLDEILSWCVYYKQSHSNSRRMYYYRKSREAIMLNTIKRMKMPLWDRIYYSLLVRIRYLKDDFKELKLFRFSINIKNRTVKLILFKKEIFKKNF